MKKIIFYLLVVFSLTSSVYSTNYYVSNSGNDTNNGLTLNLSWATLQYAANKVAAGDCVLVANGTYTGFYISASGNSGNSIVFKALGSGVTINQPNGTTNDGINIEGGNWIVIEGFRVVNQPRTGIRVVNADHCVIRKNYCDNNSRWGILTGFAENIIIEYNECLNSQVEHGIYFSNSADNPIIRYNKCHHNNANGIHMNGDISLGGDGIITNARVEGNIIYENGVAGGSGINCDGVSNSIFLNNLLYSNHASGISLYKIDGGAGSSNNKVYNNTIINASNARWCVNINDNSTGNSVYNNILINQHPTRGSITISTNSLSGFTSNNNILINRMSADGDNTTITLAAWQAKGYDSNSILAAAQTGIFVNPANADYHLLVSSQAIDKGSSTVSASVTKDLDLNPRPQGGSWDIGCYEFPQPNSTSETNQSECGVVLLPNPFSSQTIFTLTCPIQNTLIKIYSLSGQEVKRIAGVGSTSQVNREGLEKGIYFYQIVSENCIVTSGKLIVQ